MWYPSVGWTTLLSVVQPALGYHITNSQSRYITPTRLKSAHYSLYNNAPSSRKLLKMDVLTSETCWAVNWHNKASVIKLIYLYSNIKMMHGPIRIRLTFNLFQCDPFAAVNWRKHKKASKDDVSHKNILLKWIKINLITVIIMKNQKKFCKWIKNPDLFFRNHSY